MVKIKFSTSGWRAIISEDFTFANVRLVCQAIADYIKTESKNNKTENKNIVIAYQIIRKKCAGGINFTTSHNPPHYNGIKFPSQTGGSATLDITKIIERNIGKLQKQKKLKVYAPNEKFIVTKKKYENCINSPYCLPRFYRRPRTPCS
ncbi:MAG: hypothetical protein K9L71_04205 [Candidatus Omnitrophica bacterium]|nr:hypothetical protein [Candidatus Omnitrophota bacterium]